MLLKIFLSSEFFFDLRRFFSNSKTFFLSSYFFRLLIFRLLNFSSSSYLFVFLFWLCCFVFNECGVFSDVQKTDVQSLIKKRSKAKQVMESRVVNKEKTQTLTLLLCFSSYKISIILLLCWSFASFFFHFCSLYFSLLVTCHTQKKRSKWKERFKFSHQMAFMTDYVSEISPFDSDYTTRKTTVLNAN